jgi:hypothetical protein
VIFSAAAGGTHQPPLAFHAPETKRQIAVNRSLADRLNNDWLQRQIGALPQLCA